MPLITMPILNRYINLLLALIICSLSSIALIANHFVSKYPGNNYFPPGTVLIALSLGLIWLGCYLLFDKTAVYNKIARELNYFFLLLSVVAFATNAAQLTPFSPIDKQLVVLDKSLGLDLEKIVAWVACKPWLNTILALSYDSLPSQMALLPLLLIFARKFSELRAYYSLMLISTLLGFLFYYFWPTTGPASVLASPYFTPSQYATGIKFTEIHNRIAPSTINGGMIAMPSFHVIWAVLCLQLSRCWPVLFALLLPLNLLLIVSCVLLGWHYFSDLIGSFIVLAASFYIYSRTQNKQSAYQKSNSVALNPSQP